MAWAFLFKGMAELAQFSWQVGEERGRRGPGAERCECASLGGGKQNPVFSLITPYDASPVVCEREDGEAWRKCSH